MRISLKFLSAAVFCFFTSFCAADNWEEFIGPERRALLNSVRDFPATFYVSTSGNDAWSGRLAEPNADKTDGPLKSFEKAQAAVREYRKSAEFDSKKPTVVEVLPGTYELLKGLQFSSEDSGTAESPVVWRGTFSETNRNEPVAHLRGGRILNGAKPVTDEKILSRIKPEIRDKMVQFDLKAAGIDDFGTPDCRNRIELFLDDEAMTPSRFPNTGFLHIEKGITEGNTEVDIRGTKGVAEPRFIVKEDADFAAWQNEPSPWAFGYWFWDWASTRQPIQKIDPEKKILELGGQNHSYGYRNKQYFYVYNLLCEVDMPGEYYIDTETGILYLYPPKNYEEKELCVSLIPTIAEGSGLSHFVFCGFHLDSCRSVAVKLNGDDITVCACKVRNVGGYAIQANGSRNLFFGNHLYNLGEGGIFFGGGERKTLTEAKSAVVDNDIHHYGRVERVYTPGVRFGGCGLYVAQNRIAHAPHCGILFGGNENLIELNEIFDVCTETNDAGAIYCGCDWTQRGNVIKNNYLHEISGLNDLGCVGVYLDDMYSGTDVIGNLFVDVTAAAFIGGGRDCNVMNNIFVDCHPAIHLDARALNWAWKRGDEWVKEATEEGTLGGIDYKNELWSSRYPKLSVILDGTPKAPEGNLFARNAVIHLNLESEQPRIFDEQNWTDARVEPDARPYLNMEDNIIGDIRILNQLEQDPGSLFPNAKEKFERIPTERIGRFDHSAATGQGE